MCLFQKVYKTCKINILSIKNILKSLGHLSRRLDEGQGDEENDENLQNHKGNTHSKCRKCSHITKSTLSEQSSTEIGSKCFFT